MNSRHRHWRRGRRASISWLPLIPVGGEEEAEGNMKSCAASVERSIDEDGDNGDDDDGPFDVRGGYSPETLESTVFLLSRLQAVMTRAWDLAEVSPAAAIASAATTATAAAVAVEHDCGGGGTASGGALGSTKATSGSVAGEYGSSCTPEDNEDEDDGDALADAFVGSTTMARKWDWVRCCHLPVNPALGASSGRVGGEGVGGGAQPAIAPVAIDSTFCHRTLRPGRPGPGGCTLEQVSQDMCGCAGELPGEFSYCRIR